jgi:hypothetical protein
MMSVGKVNPESKGNYLNNSDQMTTLSFLVSAKPACKLHGCLNASPQKQKGRKNDCLFPSDHTTNVTESK